jgi:RNA polymerase sigma factor (sigma-70 family)
VATTDFELLDAWREGDGAAGELLFERHFTAVCRFFRSKTDVEADDLIQRTFLACVEHHGQFRKQSSFRTYLLAIARNELLGYLRRRNGVRGAIDTTVRSILDLDPSPSAAVVARQDEEHLLEALRSLPLDLQIVVELYYWEDMTSQAIAEVLEIPHGTARSRLRRAKEALRRVLNSAPGEELHDRARALSRSLSVEPRDAVARPRRQRGQ